MMWLDELVYAYKEKYILFYGQSTAGAEDISIDVEIRI